MSVIGKQMVELDERKCVGEFKVDPLQCKEPPSDIVMRPLDKIFVDLLVLRMQDSPTASMAPMILCCNLGKLTLFTISCMPAY